MLPRSVSGLQQRLCDKSHMLVGAKVCDLTEDLLWFVCGLYVGILTSYLSKDHGRPLKLDNVTTYLANFQPKVADSSCGILTSPLTLLLLVLFMANM